MLREAGRPGGSGGDHGGRWWKNGSEGESGRGRLATCAAVGGGAAGVLQGRAAGERGGRRSSEHRKGVGQGYDGGAATPPCRRRDSCGCGQENEGGPRRSAVVSASDGGANAGPITAIYNEIYIK